MQQLDLFQWADTRPAPSNIVDAMPHLRRKAESYLWGVLTKTLPPEHDDCIVFNISFESNHSDHERIVA